MVALATADLESHVVALDTASGRVLKRIRSVEAPRSIESSPFGQVVVAHTPIGALSILDAATLSVRSVLRSLGAPRYTAMHPGESLAYVTDSGRHEVVTVDLDRARVVHRTRVPGPARHVSVDGGRSLWTVLGPRRTGSRCSTCQSRAGRAWRVSSSRRSSPTTSCSHPTAVMCG